jgi:hypothetical protein
VALEVALEVVLEEVLEGMAVPVAADGKFSAPV